MERTALAWMRPAPTPVPERFDRQLLGPVLWQALLRDGITTHVWGDVAIPADRVETPEIRAASLAAIVPRRGVVGRVAAAWVHTGGPRPARIDVLVAPHARRPDPHPQRVPHECVLPADDVVVRGPLRVTTVERTAVDVARWTPEAETSRVLERLALIAGLDPKRALARLGELAGHRGVHEAHEALERLVGPARAQAGELTPPRSRPPRAHRRPANP
ncbi:MAG: hypothetical protein ACOH2F_18285 [Cellulomonas sp.]